MKNDNLSEVMTIVTKSMFFGKHPPRLSNWFAPFQAKSESKLQT